MKSNALNFAKITDFTKFHRSVRFFTNDSKFHKQYHGMKSRIKAVRTYWTWDTFLPWLLGLADSGLAGLSLQRPTSRK